MKKLYIFIYFIKSNIFITCYLNIIHIENYIEKANRAESTDISTTFHNECNSFMNSSGSFFTVKETAKIICERLLKLFVSLNDHKCNIESNLENKKCSEFLNYWVNFKLRKSMKYEDYSVRHVYDLLESQITGVDGYNIYLNLICDINKDDLYKMNILYRLYENYTELNDIIETKLDENKGSLLTLSTACCPDYNEANYICNSGNINNNIGTFCDKFNEFKSKYDDLYQKVAQKGDDYSNNFIKLEECPNTKIITTAVTGSIIGLMPLLGVLYKVSELNIKL
ncbi:hypothetical protein PVIIG_05265 [Plasmodium vivax India VII]|uniref:Uncharacterized protein n=1 Tax=Plasmodium vivax India VII TaxID=1077284 RepID=A0A0J9SIX3_PLAVI|nr:hypothetical protein PVIIG_05265 [Plasmodium vivax India VII]